MVYGDYGWIKYISGWRALPVMIAYMLAQSTGESVAARKEEAGVANDAAAAAAEADLAQHAGDVGEWLGVDSGAPQASSPAQVALA